MLTRSSSRWPRPPTPAATVQIEKVPSLAALELMCDEWHALWRRCPDAMPFQSPAWILSWGRHFAPDRVAAVAVRQRGELVALVPFFTWNRRLLLAGTGPTDYCDGLFAPEYAGTAATVLAELGVAAAALGAAEVDLQQLRPESPLLTAPAPAGSHDEVCAGVLCPVAELAGEAGVGGVSTERLRKVARLRRQLEQQPGFELGPALAPELPHAHETLEQLHARRWSERGEPGVLGDPLMRAFLRTALPALNEAGLLRIQRARVSGETIAIVVALHARTATYFYLGGFNPEWSRFSPGTLTVLSAMSRAAAEGAHEFHFLRGAETYKYHLGAKDRPTYRRMLSRPRAACA